MVTPMDQFISQHASEKLLFSVDGNQHGDPQLAKVQGIRNYRMLSSEGDTHIICPGKVKSSLLEEAERV